MSPFQNFPQCPSHAFFVSCWLGVSRCRACEGSTHVIHSDKLPLGQKFVVAPAASNRNYSKELLLCDNQSQQDYSCATINSTELTVVITITSNRASSQDAWCAPYKPLQHFLLILLWLQQLVQYKLFELTICFFNKTICVHIFVSTSVLCVDNLVPQGQFILTIAFNRNIYNNHYYSVADIIDTLSQVTLIVYVFVFEVYSKSRNPIPVILANSE